MKLTIYLLISTITFIFTGTAHGSSKNNISETRYLETETELCAEKINEFLAIRGKGGSLVGSGQIILDVAKKYEVSPSFLLALISFESGYGKKTIKPFNYGGIKTKTGKSYRTFSSVEDGVEAVAKLIRDNYHIRRKLYSIEKINKIYAPSWDGKNNYKWAKDIKSIRSKIIKTTAKL